jgi:hypothetical protein
MGSAPSTNGREEGSMYVISGKVGRKTLGRQRCRWTDNIEMDLGEMEWSDVDWTGLA